MGQDWIVAYHHEAVAELEALRDRAQRRGVLRVVAILEQLGPRATEPHAKPVQGTRGLRELRPGGGRIAVRPLYARVGDRHFVILAVAPEAIVDRRGFESAVRRASERAHVDYGLRL